MWVNISRRLMERDPRRLGMVRSHWPAVLSASGQVGRAAGERKSPERFQEALAKKGVTGHSRKQ